MIVSPDLGLVAAQTQAKAAWWQVAAACAQAVISGAAIWAAVIIANRQTRTDAARRERERAEIARDVAMVHVRAFRAWDEKTRHLKKIAEQGQAGALNMLQLVQGDEYLFQPPESLRVLAGNLREFDNAAKAVQRSFIAAQEFKEMRTVMTGWALAIAAERSDGVDFDKVLRLTTECLTAIPAARNAVDALLVLKQS
ncbi:hypothetical protein [Dyella flagellata]|uniref:Uncharacterized protein n=1 Tax=Dyella flagellata TaxID=1867833 RepID=A0ABQ5XBT3_9GAMM|nr:hypothetical protein [Dyella flagellata]GLQ89156.1 hypothetical protein GCM10007898_27280 [Dyella flagellata]